MLRAAIAIALSVLVAATQAAEPTTLPLRGGWEFRLAPAGTQVAGERAAADWHAATVPGNVHTDLLASHLIPDPYVGAPEAALQWVGLSDWEYRTHFVVDAATLKRSHHELVFFGLDTFADVYLNGTRILVADNAFRTWRVPVRVPLLAGDNELRVLLHSPIARVLPAVQAMPHKLAGNYPSPYGDEPRDAMTGNFVRKPGYHYGWDWGPRYVTAGIWRAVELQSWDTLRIDDLHIRQDTVDVGIAELVVQGDVEAARAQCVTLQVDAVGTDNKMDGSPGNKADGSPGNKMDGGRVNQPAAARVRQACLHVGHNDVRVPLAIKQPRLWWPNGSGEQALYSFRLRVLAAGAVQAQAVRRTGLRRVELRRERDASGRGFELVINGQPLFAKGADVIPFDAFPARVTGAQQRQVLTAARDAHMNLLRSWGGGYYESDEFFDLADELGLMIWQDFMFGGGVVPAYDAAFRANVLAEARQNVRRLRDHPSLVLWCGNNEEETAWKDWGIGERLTAEDPPFAQQVWDGYVQLFGRDLRGVVAQESGGIPYWSSSPSNDLDVKANDTNNGDKHYWDVWGGPAKPVDAYIEETPRFMSEYGLQGWPVLKTIRSFARPDESRIDAPVIRAHQKFMAGDGNTRLLQYIRGEYGEPRDFADFVYLSQVMQAEGIELGALHHRASRPRTMGSLYWQLNDVWPGASWSSIDYYGRWKALHFHARRFFADLAVAALRRAGHTHVALMSDRSVATSGEVRLRVIEFGGRLLRDERWPVTLAPLAATTVADYSDADLLRGADSTQTAAADQTQTAAADPTRTAAVFELLVDGKVASRGVVYFDAAKRLSLPDPGLRAQLTRDGEPDAAGMDDRLRQLSALEGQSKNAVYRYRLDLHADKLARAVWVDFGDVDATLSDNALTLLPGEAVTLEVSSQSSLDELQRTLQLRWLGGSQTR